MAAAIEMIYPPSQNTVPPWRDKPAEECEAGDPPKLQCQYGEQPCVLAARLAQADASGDFAEENEDTMAVRPWSFIYPSALTWCMPYMSLASSPVSR